MNGEDLYLPTAPNKLVRGIRVDSGIPLQSAAKVPIMITFNVIDRDGDENDIKPQACIFKVNLYLSWTQVDRKFWFKLPFQLFSSTNKFKPENLLGSVSTLVVLLSYHFCGVGYTVSILQH